MKFLAFLFALPLAAQSLSIACPAPEKFNQSASCQINFTGGASALQWKIASSVSLTVTSAIPGKSLASANGTYLLIGTNATNLSGTVATITVPPHAGTVTLTLSNVLGSSPTGHAVTVNPAASVTVQ